ncbi:hypothetical protein Isop_0224 [Isosphaera pallida ATCC 43644]|uniref:Uncharacterized protein n=1 Tax=Isosphaera pallida (strain ATCC 43644 / DSM 9630 / IS1B) TaxID=575540 RepID=E8QWD4_ISOPI|nr:hypothetical protein Isop_0224 [Isosphaera pallida ATCC 43644]
MDRFPPFPPEISSFLDAVARVPSDPRAFEQGSDQRDDVGQPNQM